MKWWLFIVLGILVLGAYGFYNYSESVSDFPETSYVSKVIDGDTVIIKGESVRLLGIDCDERGYDCYDEAKKRVEELILDEEVTLEIGCSSDFLFECGEDKDKYGRRLRYVFLDGRNINLQLVEEGLAVARFSPENKKYKEEILEAEKYARENGVGCKWGEDEGSSEDKGSDNSGGDEGAEGEENERTEEDNGGAGKEGMGDVICSEDVYNCGDFEIQKESQEVFDYCGGVDNDVHRLDGNGDGEACEELS